ncbi:MAG: hypothetical protein EOP39_04625 [Rubrivivax sp.]|nr:MAG: hypothetical protein EOP39_04625 [Rubrivivax sp.]
MAAAEACFTPPPVIEPGGMFTAEDYETDPVEVWPDCWKSWQLFCEMSGQWRTSGMGERTALDYTPLMLRMQHMGLSGEAWNDTFRDIRVIEGAALDAMQGKKPDS